VFLRLANPATPREHIPCRKLGKSRAAMVISLQSWVPALSAEVAAADQPSLLFFMRAEKESRLAMDDIKKRSDAGKKRAISGHEVNQ
jgi:hypothetical protein